MSYDPWKTERGKKSDRSRNARRKAKGFDSWYAKPGGSDFPGIDTRRRSKRSAIRHMKKTKPHSKDEWSRFYAYLNGGNVNILNEATAAIPTITVGATPNLLGQGFIGPPLPPGGGGGGGGGGGPPPPPGGGGGGGGSFLENLMRGGRTIPGFLDTLLGRGPPPPPPPPSPTVEEMGPFQIDLQGTMLKSQENIRIKRKEKEKPIEVSMNYPPLPPGGGGLKMEQSIPWTLKEGRKAKDLIEKRSNGAPPFPPAGGSIGSNPFSGWNPISAKWGSPQANEISGPWKGLKDIFKSKLGMPLDLVVGKPPPPPPPPGGGAETKAAKKKRLRRATSYTPDNMDVVVDDGPPGPPPAPPGAGAIVNDAMDLDMDVAGIREKKSKRRRSSGGQGPRKRANTGVADIAYPPRPGQNISVQDFKEKPRRALGRETIAPPAPSRENPNSSYSTPAPQIGNNLSAVPNMGINRIPSLPLPPLSLPSSPPLKKAKSPPPSPRLQTPRNQDPGAYAGLGAIPNFNSNLIGLPFVPPPVPSGDNSNVNSTRVNAPRPRAKSVLISDDPNY